MVIEVTKTINRDWCDVRGKESANQHENNYAIINKQSVQYMHSVSGIIDLVIQAENTCTWQGGRGFFFNQQITNAKKENRKKEKKRTISLYVQTFY